MRSALHGHTRRGLGLPVCGLLVAAIGCSAPRSSGDDRASQAAPVHSASQAAPVRTASQAAPATSVPELSALELDRLEYTFQAAELVRRDWPAMEASRTCLLLIDVGLQWVVNCEVAPSGFQPTAQRFREHSVFVHTGDRFDAGGRARSTAELLTTTPAAAQVPLSAAETTGLPGAQPWLVAGTLDALTRYHPAFAKATTEAWVSVLMHELVHTHQLRVPGAERFVTAVQSLQRTPAALTALYRNNSHYRGLIEREYKLLTRAARAAPSDRNAAQRALRDWHSLYRRRVASLQVSPETEQLIEDDLLFSYIEGVARFVESEYLERASYHPRRSLADDPRFHDYDMFRDGGYAASPNRQLDDHYFYAIGYHLCVLLDRVDQHWRSRVHAQPRWLLDLVEQVAETDK